MTKEEVREKVQKDVMEFFALTEYSEEKTFEAMGADSLDIVDLSLWFEESLEMEIPDEKVGELKTPADVVDWFWSQLTESGS